MRFFSLLTNVVTHLQLIAAFNVLAVKWPDGLRELVRGLSFINLDLQWVEDQFPDLPPFPVRLRNLIAFALLPFLVLWIASGMLMLLAMPQLVLFFVAIVQVPFAAINADHPAEIIFVTIILILAVLSNPIFLCKFNDPDERPGAFIPKLLRRAQDAFPPASFVGGIFIAYFGRDVNASIIAGSLLAVVGCVCTVSVVLQNATPVGRIDRYSRICRLSTFLGRQTMGMVFFAFNAAVIPILTLGLESITFVEYKCPEGSMFNPYVQRDEENQYSTSSSLFCDPCNFTNPTRCLSTTVGAAAAGSVGNLSAALCPASTYQRLALDPQTPRSSNWLYGGLLFAFLAYGLIMMGLFLCSMRRGINKAAEAFKPGEPLANVNIKEALAQRTGDDEDDEGEKKAGEGTIQGGGDDLEFRVLSETQHEPGQLFGGAGGDAAKDRWEFVCESVEAKVFEFCSDYRYPMRYTYAMLMLHKALIVIVSVPLAPTSTSGAAAGMATVHGLVLLFLIFARPFRSKLLTRLTLAEVACEFLVGIFAAISSDESSDVPPGLGVAVLIINIVLPVVAIASTASELKGKWEERKEKSRRREAYDKAHEESLLGDSGGAERGAEMSPMMSPPPPPQQPMPMNTAGGSITEDGGGQQPQQQQQAYYPPPQGYVQQHPGGGGGPPPVYPAGPPPQPMMQQQAQYPQQYQQQQQGFGVAGYGQQQQYQPAAMMMTMPPQPPLVGSSISAAARREKVRQAALALPEAKVADSIDGSSKWIVTIPALVLFIPLIVASWYVLITSAQEQSIGIPTLDSPTEFLPSSPRTSDPLQDILKQRNSYGNFSAFANDACCFAGTVTSLPQFPVGKLPNQERWIWRDSTFSSPPRLRVVNHARIDLSVHDPRGSNGPYGVNGFGIRSMCAASLTPYCSMTNVGSGQFPPRASCVSTFSQYALDYLW